jgi:phage terminase large subunit-like protein
MYPILSVFLLQFLNLRVNLRNQTLIIDLLTVDNAANLAVGYVEDRRQSLSEAEARVLLEAAWEDVDDVDRFLASISLWDACRDDLPPLSPYEPCVLAMDAGESSDTFATVIISAHPESPERLAVRYARAYVPKGAPLDFDAIEQDIRDLVARYAVQQIAYDPFLLGQMMRRLSAPGRQIAAPLEPFPQGAQRLAGDKLLSDLIHQRRIVHDGNSDLRKHLDHADKKLGPEGRTLRIVKRAQSLKIDLAVATAMGAARALELFGTPTGPIGVFASGRAKVQLGDHRG